MMLHPPLLIKCSFHYFQVAEAQLKKETGDIFPTNAGETTFENKTAGDVMTQRPHNVKPDTLAVDALNLMEKNLEKLQSLKNTCTFASRQFFGG